MSAGEPGMSEESRKCLPGDEEESSPARERARGGASRRKPRGGFPFLRPHPDHCAAAGRREARRNHESD